ncbi:MAG: MarR family winged helix-turn-helix transcriptional regulator [Bacteroidota bacterium]
MNTEKAVLRVRAFNRFYTNVIAVLDQSVLHTGYSLAEARVMFEVDRLQPCSARDLLEVITIDEGYLSRILHAFVRRGLLHRQQSHVDKRRYTLALSEEGKAALNQLVNVANRATGQVIRHLSDQEVAALVGSMQQIQSLLGPTTSSNTRTSYEPFT